ncbi:hypothetical protein HDV00_009650 [Rhizophlyctis rosea]|nr:hypothetical protein HDV00_009650 [Rhizophlyctis rosea]
MMASPDLSSPAANGRRLWKRFTMSRRSQSSISPSPTPTPHETPDYTEDHPKPSTFLSVPDSQSPDDTPSSSSSRLSTDSRTSRRHSLSSLLSRRRGSSPTPPTNPLSPPSPQQNTRTTAPPPPLPTLQFDPTPTYTPDPLPSPWHDLLPPTYHTLTEHSSKYSLTAHIPDGMSTRDVLQVFVFDDSREVGLAGSETQMGVRIRVPDDANLRDVKACVAGGVLTVTVAKAAE